MSGIIIRNRIDLNISYNGIGMISDIYSGIASQSGSLPRILGYS